MNHQFPYLTHLAPTIAPRLSRTAASLAVMLAAAGYSQTGLAANDYAGQCASCHGASPTGAGSPFSFKGKKDASATKAAINGSVAMMAGLKALTDSELNAIALQMGGKADLGAAPPTPKPSASPAPKPSASPTPKPSASPTPAPSASPTPAPSASPTPAPSASPTPAPSASPTPAPSASPVPAPPQGSCDGAGKNAKPVMSPIAEQNATVGQELSFTVTALDCNDVPIVIKASKLTGSSIPSEGQDFDDSGLWSGKFVFTPTANQVNKSFKVKFKAVETEDSHKASKPWTVRIRVFPAGSSYDDGSVTGVRVQSARWSGNKLLVKGKVQFSNALNKQDRKTWIENTEVSIANPNGTAYGSFPVKANGQWTASIKDLSETTVPCEVSAQFNGRTGSRTVKKAPETCAR